MELGKLTSRKLAAAITGMVAIIGLTVVVALYPETQEFAGKALIALGGVILTAIGAQTLLDTAKGS